MLEVASWCCIWYGKKGLVEMVLWKWVWCNMEHILYAGALSPERSFDPNDTLQPPGKEDSGAIEQHYSMSLIPQF